MLLHGDGWHVLLESKAVAGADSAGPERRVSAYCDLIGDRRDLLPLHVAVSGSAA